MTSRQFTITLSIVIGVILIMLWNLKQSNLSNFTDKNQKANEITSPPPIDQNIKISSENSSINNNVLLPNNIELFLDGTTVKLGSLLDKEKENLFLRINENYCVDCIDSIAVILNEAKFNNQWRLIILGTFSSNTSRAYFKKKFNKTTLIYDVDDLPLPGEQALQPYFFTVKNQKTKLSFFPLKEHQSHSRKYIKQFTNEN